MSHRIETFTRVGLTFEVIDSGPIEGDVVVLLHGFPQFHTAWEAVAARLHEQGFRTLAPLQRGYSPDARPHGRGSYRVSELVEDVSALVGQVTGAVHLVGHDWGAAVAWAFTLRHPDLVRTLTALSVPHPGAFLKAMPRGQLLRSWYMAMFNVPLLPEWLLSDRNRARRVLARSGMKREAFADFWRDFGDGAALSGGLGWYRALAFTNPRRTGTPVTVPTTYIWSDGDTALGRRGAELCEQYVDAPYRFEVLAGASHWLLDERADDVARIVLERVRDA